MGNSNLFAGQDSISSLLFTELGNKRMRGDDFQIAPCTILVHSIFII